MSKKKEKQVNNGQVIIPNKHPNPPAQNEIDVAYIMSRHYRCVVEFLAPIYDYKRKTADIIMNGVEWEIKCPIGNSKSTIGNQLRWGSKQSKSIVLDTRHTKLTYDDVEKRVLKEVNRKTTIRRIILINKLGKVIELKK